MLSVLSNHSAPARRRSHDGESVAVAVAVVVWGMVVVMLDS